MQRQVQMRMQVQMQLQMQLQMQMQMQLQIQMQLQMRVQMQMQMQMQILPHNISWTTTGYGMFWGDAFRTIFYEFLTNRGHDTNKVDCLC